MESNYPNGSTYCSFETNNASHFVDSCQNDLKYDGRGFASKVNLYSQIGCKGESSFAENVSNRLNTTPIEPGYTQFDDRYKTPLNNIPENNVYFSYYEHYKYQPKVNANNQYLPYVPPPQSACYNNYNVSLKGIQNTKECYLQQMSNFSTDLLYMRNPCQNQSRGQSNHNVQSHIYAYRSNQKHNFSTRSQPQATPEASNLYWNGYNHNYTGCSSNIRSDVRNNFYDTGHYNTNFAHTTNPNNASSYCDAGYHRPTWGMSTVSHQQTIPSNYATYNYSTVNQVNPGNCCADRKEDENRTKHTTSAYHKYSLIQEPTDSSNVTNQQHTNGYAGMSFEYNVDRYNPYNYQSNLGFNQNRIDLHNFQENTSISYIPNNNYVADSGSKANNTKPQSLRDFIITWNEDEEDIPGNKFDTHLNRDPVVCDKIENHLAAKATFSRPKIHVGITVDSSVGADQYINLPDIIIDIEKSKEPKELVDKNYLIVNSPLQSHSDIDENIMLNCESMVDVNDNLLPEELSTSLCDQIKTLNKKLNYHKRLGIKRQIEKSKQYALRKLRQFRPQRFRQNSRFNPKSLVKLCIDEINKNTFRNAFTFQYLNINTSLNQRDVEHFIPTLSDLCKSALNNCTRNDRPLIVGNNENNDNVFVINLDEVIESDNLLLVQSNVNENSSEGDEHIREKNLPHSYMLHNECNIFENEISDIFNNNNDSFSNKNGSEMFIQNFDDSIHHEEIVQNNYRQFEKEKLIKYLKEKYTKRIYSDGIGCTKKIIKRYKQNRWYS